MHNVLQEFKENREKQYISFYVYNHHILKKIQIKFTKVLTKMFLELRFLLTKSEFQNLHFVLF